jgi:acid stress chaperone HdeB
MTFPRVEEERKETAMDALRIAACALAASFVMTGATKAQVSVDMSKVTCEQLLAASPNAVDAAVWLSGYYNGLQKNTMLDLNQFKKNAEIVIAECRADQNKTVMGAVEALTSRK